MKKMYLFLTAFMLLFSVSANALIVSVNGHGEIGENGMELTLSEAEEDPLSGIPTMSITGSVLCNSSLQVTIRRSANGIRDEFCCGQCTAGNQTTEETLNYSPDGLSTWFMHYFPAENSYETIEYLFSEGSDSFRLIVHLQNGKETGEDTPTSFPKKHLIEEFTGQDCGYCPDGMNSISSFINGEDNWVLVLHHAGFYQDNFTVKGSETISDKMDVNGAPSVSIDRQLTSYYEGVKTVFHPGYLSSDMKSQYESTTYASIDIANTYDASSRTLNVHVSGFIAKEDYPSLQLTVLVKESGMIDYQSDYYYTFEGWKEFRHTNAVRAFLTAAIGDALTIGSDHRYSTDLSLVLDASWVPENCMVVAFLSEAFKPVVQAEQSPVVSGSKGGADITHGGVSAVPVSSFYPEPSANAKPADYSKLDAEELTTAEAYYETDKENNVNRWTIQAYSTNRTVIVDGVSTYPFAQIFLFTKTKQTALPNGTYVFSTTIEPGTAYAGVRNDEEFYIDGSEFMFTNRSYFNQGYLVPQAQWLIARGKLVITDTDWSVTGTARNGQPIRLIGTSPINYPGRSNAIDEVITEENTRSERCVKFLQNNHLMIRTQDGNTFNILGQPIR